MPVLAFTTVAESVFDSYFRGIPKLTGPKPFDTDRIPESSGRRRYSTCRLCPPVKCGLRIHTWCRGAGPRSARAGWSPACNPSGPAPPFLGSAPCTACKETQAACTGAVLCRGTRTPDALPAPETMTLGRKQGNQSTETSTWDYA